MYVRFVVGAQGGDHRNMTGLITEARLLTEQVQLEPYETAEVHSVFDWFNEHVPCPPFEESGWPSDVVAWFKGSAKQEIQVMRRLVPLLEAHGRYVRLVRSADPGRIFYEDDVQVVVEEWPRIKKSYWLYVPKREVR